MPKDLDRDSEVIVLNTPLFENKVEGYDEDSLPPLGLGYIATKLINQGIQTKLLDAVAYNIPVNQIIDTVNARSFKVLAMNVFTTNHHLVKKIIQNINKDIHIIVGGLSTKSLYEDIFKYDSESKIDIVMGDGENIICDLVNNQMKEPPFQHSKNCNYFIVDINSKYYQHDISNIPLDRSFFSNEPVLNHLNSKMEVSIVTSRGCIYNCTFCAAARSQNKNIGIRERNIEDVSKEITHLKEIYSNIGSIRVLDDLFLKNLHSVERATEMFNNHQINWRAMAHVMSFKNLTSEDLKKLSLSGCSELFIGIESGSRSLLKSINKTSDIELIKNTIFKIMSSGISIKGYFIYGFPGETELDCKNTYELAYSLKELSLKTPSSFRTSVFRYRPYHGTEIYHDLELKGKLLTLKQDNDLKHILDRQQFNFYIENFSSTPNEIIAKYITLTNQLNY